MAETHFRYRNLTVVVDTTELAEFDRQNLVLSDAEMERVAFVLKKEPFSAESRYVGNLIVREVLGYDFIYFVGREGPNSVVTIWGIRKPDPKNRTEEVLKLLTQVDMWRGVTGL